jgi:hypothetical protein
MAIALTGVACGTQVSDPYSPSDPMRYRVDYLIEPRPAGGNALVSLQVTQSGGLLRELTMRMGARYSQIRADGQLVVDDSVVRWRPPAEGGQIAWRVNIPNRRNGGGYDAWLGMDFGLFRAEDIIPRAASRALRGARSESWVSFGLPATWSAVTQYFNDSGQLRIDNPERRFDQPTGWIVMGDLGVRRERIAGMRVAVAGPVDHSVRRMDTLALLHWIVPELARLLPELPSRLTIVSAGDPMWRGGLSAPQSLFLHAERPLISENATSTLLHELMHMSLGLRAHDGYDWIVEGFAEYYSLELLHRSGTISSTRYATAIADLAEWATQAENLCGPASSGATTALAVGVLAALNEEIVSTSNDDASLDQVARELWKLDAKVDISSLESAVETVTGHKPDALHSTRLPGCRTIASASQAL